MYVKMHDFNHRFWAACFLSLHVRFVSQLLSETLKARNLHVSGSKCSHILMLATYRAIGVTVPDISLFVYICCALLRLL